MKQPAVYILTNESFGTLYIGVTSNLIQRIYQHRNNLIDGFSKQHGLHRLVYYEMVEEMTQAIIREKQMKKWNRQWKLNLIQRTNPEWWDLYPEITGENGPPPARG